MPLELGRRLRPRSHPVLMSLVSQGAKSSRCQAIATVPEPAFEQYVTEVREQGRADGKTDLTTAGAQLPYQSYIDHESMRWRDANLLSRFIS